ncbi:TcfC E-set like domain-containing protein [Microbulbifer marinus]|uniref:Outer membrane usher protein FimD/PapC n=1 Tax=Microbulbifer marinus TaxID=658218 RepID=A0A1H4AFI7_9GAMM|nr:TcfC E-set like domain-containing protein [Microbulbifer marinus]SEA34294.1 Outer membrane usher protein FimD/PapC [Microbulbifer marinus]
MIRTIVRMSLVLSLLAFKNNSYAASAAFTLETSAPDGFAELTEPQQLVAELYYGSRPLGPVQVTVDPQSVRFRDPQAVLALLPPTLDPDVVLLALLGPQPRNSHRICYSNRQRNCGVLQPESFGLIYDESRFRIDAFLAPALLPQQAAITDPYLPEASSDFSYVQSLTGSWSGVRSDSGPDTQSASLFGQSILGFGASGLHSHWSANDAGESQIYHLHWARDYRGKAYSAGLIQPQGGFSSFTAAPYLYGLEFRSSNNSRIDNRYQQGAPLEVNMPVRGRVEVHRDGRLLHSELLEAGNQLLNTSSLPGGAYTVEVRTFDDSGRPLAQYTEFFAKDSQLPAPGEWRWSFQTGRPALLNADTLLPEQADDFVAQASVARRLFDSTGLFVTGALTQDEQLLELGGRWISEYLELSPSLLQTSDGRSGHRLHAILRSPWLNLSLTEAQLDDATTLPTDNNYSLLGRGFYQRSASLNAGLFGGQLSLRYSERDRGVSLATPDFTLDETATGADKLTTLEYRRNIFRNRHWHGDLTLAHSEADGQQLTSASFQFRMRGDRWSHSARLRSEIDESGDQLTRAGIDSSWNDRDLWAMEVEQQFSSEIAENEYYLGSNTRVAGHRGFFSSTLDYIDTERGKSLNYLGNFSTNLISDGREFAWGGERSYNSAVLVDIAGSEDQDFEILVDGARRGYAKGGARSLVNLPSFGSYDISLRPLTEGFYDYSDVSETVTLYPGSVAKTQYEIKPVILTMGRIVNGDRPVKNARFSIGGQSTVTDEFGVFQLQLYGDPRRLQVPPVRWQDCLVEVPEQTSGEHWLNLGTIDLQHAQCAEGKIITVAQGDNDGR